MSLVVISSSTIVSSRNTHSSSAPEEDAGLVSSSSQKNWPAAPCSMSLCNSVNGLRAAPQLRCPQGEDPQELVHRRARPPTDRSCWIDAGKAEPHLKRPRTIKTFFFLSASCGICNTPASRHRRCVSTALWRAVSNGLFALPYAHHSA
jgi:hypothetical protein